MNKKIFSITAVVTIIFLAVAFVKNQVIKTVVTTVGSTIVGAPVAIDGFSLGIFRPAVKIKGLKLYNPKGFPKEALVNIPKIEVGYDLGSIFKGKLHLTKVLIDLQEAVIIRNQDGNLNVDSLKVAQEGGKPAEAKKPSEGAIPMQIDVVTLSIGRVIVKDFSVGEKPFIQVHDVGMKDRTYKNIGSAQQLVSLILVEAMKPAAIRNAAIYGAASLVGVAFLPAGIAATLIAKDSAEANFDMNFDKVYNAGLSLLRDIGTVKEEKKDAGTIKAEIYSNDITFKAEKSEPKGIKVTVAARKMLLPQAPVASGVIYQLSEKLK